MVTEELFRKYKGINEFAEADLQELEQDIRSTGFYRQKAKNIKNSSIAILENCGDSLGPDCRGGDGVVRFRVLYKDQGRARKNV